MWLILSDIQGQQSTSFTKI